eukprot:365307-Chlamydomonas_euryale.AAC.12
MHARTPRRCRRRASMRTAAAAAAAKARQPCPRSLAGCLLLCGARAVACAAKGPHMRRATCWRQGLQVR